MAGIAGIIFKYHNDEISTYINALAKMMLKLTFSQNENVITHTGVNIFIGSAGRNSGNKKNHFTFNLKLKIYCIVEGFVFVTDNDKAKIKSRYLDVLLQEESEYVPYLYDLYKEDLVFHLTGNYNILIYNSLTGSTVLFNDHLGLLPLYYYMTDSIFVFSSKIESLLTSGLMNNIEFDDTTFLEHQLFNYPLSNYSFIKDIKTLQASNLFTFNKDDFSKAICYWSPSQLIYDKPLDKKNSIESIDSTLNEVILKSTKNNNDNIYVTLTGGFDSRVVLSYLLKINFNRISAFSFGAEYSPDIFIPKEISNGEGFKYTPYILNNSYIDNYFRDEAKNTIISSNGLRSYRRSHYLFVMKNLSEKTNRFISGNFGDELLKFSNITPSEVISKNLILLANCDFNTSIFFTNLYKELIFLKENKFKKLFDDLRERINQIEKEVCNYDSQSQKFNHIKLKLIASKYFGSEISSYNDYVNNFSPFLDIEFISEFSKTYYSGTYYNFNEKKLAQKSMTTKLYADLIFRNYNSLLNYNTDRGFPISHLMNPLGELKLFLQKKFLKPTRINDPYYLDQTSKIFQTILLTDKKAIKTQKTVFTQLNKYQSYADTKSDKILSLFYWINHITKEYID